MLFTVFPLSVIPFNASLYAVGKYLQYWSAKTWPISGMVRDFNKIERRTKIGTNFAYLYVTFGVDC